MAGGAPSGRGADGVLEISPSQDRKEEVPSCSRDKTLSFANPHEIPAHYPVPKSASKVVPYATFDGMIL